MSVRARSTVFVDIPSWVATVSCAVATLRPVALSAAAASARATRMSVSGAMLICRRALSPAGVASARARVDSQCSRLFHATTVLARLGKIQEPARCGAVGEGWVRDTRVAGEKAYCPGVRVWGTM